MNTVAISPYMRRQEIINLLQKNSFVEITYLSNYFTVSEMTIRRDLDKLEEDGEIIRLHGGAKLNTKSIYEATLEERSNKNILEKQAVATKAAELVEDGDVIALDASSTALEVSKKIKEKKKLVVVTNNISVAKELSECKDHTIILLGGIVRKKSLSLVGPHVKNMLSSIYIDKAFISSKALSFKAGLTDATIDEGEVKKAMIENSKNVYIIVDHTKINETAFYQVCDYKVMNKIITDDLGTLTEEQEACLHCFKNEGIEVIIGS